MAPPRGSWRARGGRASRGSRGLEEDITAQNIKYDFVDAVEVSVGREETLFRVPKNLICNRSTFFASACSSRWDTGDSKPRPLPDEDPEIFSIYLQLLYTGKLVIDATDTAATTAEDDRDQIQTARWWSLVKLYLLADKIGDSTTAEMLKKNISRRLDNVAAYGLPSLDLIRFVWNYTIDTRSPLRMDFAMYIARNFLYSEVVEIGSDLEEFYQDIVLAFYAIKIGRQETWRAASIIDRRSV